VGEEVQYRGRYRVGRSAVLEYCTIQCRVSKTVGVRNLMQVGG